MNEENKIIRVTLHMKTGLPVTFFTNSLTVKKNLVGALAELEWKNLYDKEKLHYVDIEQIQAITTCAVDTEIAEDESEYTA